MPNRRWHRPSGRAVVWVVVAVALVSIATGVVSIVTEPSVGAGGALGDLQSVAEFSGTVVGFALLVSAWGMRRGYRLAYVSAAVLVFVSGAHGVAQYRPLSIPLIVVSLGGFVVLVFTSQRFTRSSALTATQVGSLVAIVGVLCYGVAGSYALRGQFDDLHTVVDALYFTLVTATTVGYGDVHPTTEGARLFTISLVVLGPATLAAAAGSLFGPILEARFGRTGREVTRDGREEPERVAVVGDGALASAYADGLAERTAVTLVMPDETDAGGGESVSTVYGDLTADRTLERAGLADVDAVLVALRDPSECERALGAVRETTGADAHVVAIATGGEDALERAGADSVVDPERLLVRTAVGETLGADGRSGARDGDDGHSSASAAAQSE
ncbi:ion channel [Natronobiforma cellulositropha]|uniref:ion channel n=1 Tax=Natronobiforma cellulositropha TaxID=1679076 RepID=UPI0021D5F71C|nr:ion channel [Natronobiforma cellulositropha]